MSRNSSAKQAKNNEDIVFYETWFDFVVFKNPLSMRNANEKWFIRERTVVVEPYEPSGARSVVYTPKSSLFTAPYYRVENISRAPSLTEIPNISAVIGTGPSEEAGGEKVEITIYSLNNALQGSASTSVRSAARYQARYTEHLHLVREDSLASDSEGSPPILYVRKAFPKNGPKPPAHILFNVNIPLGVYHLLPPPFEDHVARVKEAPCREKLLNAKALWHALVFKRGETLEDAFTVDCKESLRVFPNFTRYLLPDGVWRLSLFVPYPKPGRSYGIHLPIPLIAFEP